jgi:predicted ATPase
VDRFGPILIEQPELHIHPRLQTNMGDLFIVASARRQFLIETHSEHLILRALRRIRETNAGELDEGAPPFTPEKLSVIYVDATHAGTTFERLRVDETGEFVDRWPHGFFEERAKELF